MQPKRMFLNVLVDSPREGAGFYRRVFDLVTAFESDWFVHLTSGGADPLELGLLQADHEILPESVRSLKTGGVLTLVVDRADDTLERALNEGATLIEAPRNLFFGQRRSLVRAPDGTVLDLSSPCTPDPEWMKRVSSREGGGYVEQT